MTELCMLWLEEETRTVEKKTICLKLRQILSRPRGQPSPSDDWTDKPEGPSSFMSKRIWYKVHGHRRPCLHPFGFLLVPKLQLKSPSN